MEELTYDKIEVGKRFAGLDYPITADLVHKFKKATQDSSPADEFAPAGLAAVFARLSYLKEYKMPGGGVLAKQSFSFRRPFRIGETLRLQSEVAEKYLRKERRFATIAVKAFDAEGQLACTSTVTLIWPK